MRNVLPFPTVLSTLMRPSCGSDDEVLGDGELQPVPSVSRVASESTRRPIEDALLAPAAECRSHCLRPRSPPRRRAPARAARWLVIVSRVLERVCSRFSTAPAMALRLSGIVVAAPRRLSRPRSSWSSPRAERFDGVVHHGGQGDGLQVRPSSPTMREKSSTVSIDRQSRAVSFTSRLRYRLGSLLIPSPGSSPASR